MKTFKGQYGQDIDLLEFEQTSVQRKHAITHSDNELVDPERVGEGLEIMVIDAYRYQRELSISRKQHYSHEDVQTGTMTTVKDGEYQPGVPYEPITGVPIYERKMVDKGMQWVLSAYKHPFRPPVEVVLDDKVANTLIDRIWDLATKHPILLFNSTGEGVFGPRCEGFVYWHDQLLAGAEPTVDSLP